MGRRLLLGPQEAVSGTEWRELMALGPFISERDLRGPGVTFSPQRSLTALPAPQQPPNPNAAIGTSVGVSRRKRLRDAAPAQQKSTDQTPRTDLLGGKSQTHCWQEATEHPACSPGPRPPTLLCSVTRVHDPQPPILGLKGNKKCRSHFCINRCINIKHKKTASPTGHLASSEAGGFVP